MIDQGIWTAALGRLQVELTGGQFAAWLKDSTFVKGGSNFLVVGLPNAFARETVERNFRPLVQKVVKDIASRDVDVTFIITRGDGGAAAARPSGSSPSLKASSLPVSAATEPLGPRHTFASFIVGAGNRLAHAAASRVSEHPGGAYNPLFIYGGVGLGKTHLLRAIGHAIANANPQCAVHYVTSENFTHELVSAIRSDRTTQLRTKYRSVDVLLLDDVQFIAGRESTQQEVFHTFDALHSAEKQVVLTSDRSPQDIQPLSDRLVTRFAGGLVADIQPPDLETRQAILKAKAEHCAYAVTDSVIEFLASSVTQNVRDLEGALTRVVFYAECHLVRLDVDTARRALSGGGYRRRDRAVTLDDIAGAVARHFGLDLAEFNSPSRESRLTRPRHIAMYVMREDTSYSLPAIGATLGGRDHTTVLHGYRKIAASIADDPDLQLAVESIRASLLAQP